jgi:hypothetical protein
MDTNHNDADGWIEFLKLNGKADHSRCKEREHYWTALYLELEGCEHPMLERLRFVAADARQKWSDLRESKEPKSA